MDGKQNFPRRTFTFCVDGLTSVIASLMGSSPITAFVESASGIRAGGRTGLTAVTVALYFCATLFINPLISESHQTPAHGLLPDVLMFFPESLWRSGDLCRTVPAPQWPQQTWTAPQVAVVTCSEASCLPPLQSMFCCTQSVSQRGHTLPPPPLWGGGGGGQAARFNDYDPAFLSPLPLHF